MPRKKTLTKSAAPKKLQNFEPIQDVEFDLMQDPLVSKSLSADHIDSEHEKLRRAVAHSDPDRDLTDRELLFVALHVEKRHPPILAARLAGFGQPSKSADALLRTPSVVNEIHRRQKEFEQINAMSKKRVMDGMLEAIDMAKMIAEPATAIRGWSEIAKMCGYYEPQKHELTVTSNQEIVIKKLQSLPDEELLKLAEGDVVEGEFKELPDDSE